MGSRTGPQGEKRDSSKGKNYYEENKIKNTISTYFFHVSWLQGPKVRKVFAMVNQFSAVDENLGWKVKLPQFKAQLHHLLTEKCWVCYSTFLSFNFIVYKMEIMVAPTWNRCDWLTTQHLLSTYHESLLKKAKDGSEENETRRKVSPSASSGGWHREYNPWNCGSHPVALKGTNLRQSHRLRIAE